MNINPYEFSGHCYYCGSTAFAMVEIIGPEIGKNIPLKDDRVLLQMLQKKNTVARQRARVDFNGSWNTMVSQQQLVQPAMPTQSIVQPAIPPQSQMLPQHGIPPQPLSVPQQEPYLLWHVGGLGQPVPTHAYVIYPEALWEKQPHPI